MRQIIAGICVLAFVAFTASAQTLGDEDATVDAVFNSAGQEAVLLSEILRDVAQTLTEDEDLNSEANEYFIRAIWNKTLEAVKNATAKIKHSVKGAYKEAKEHIKKAAVEAQQKLKEKAAEIMSKLLTKVAGQYALVDAQSGLNFVKTLVDLVKAAAQRLLLVGKALENLPK
ncbi:hypothetical protein MTO96_052083 [Rhipicephalus appendiculatus]